MYFDEYGDRNIAGNSRNWRNRECQFSENTCDKCKINHGKIYPFHTSPLADRYHPFCFCLIKRMRTLVAGQATQEGIGGADYFLKQTGSLPPNYITKEEALRAGWQPRNGDFDVLFPGKVIGGDEYRNSNGKLPSAPSREWREADLNYNGGYRGTDRILYSNDQLIFVSNDHYKTFYELIG